MCTWSVGCISEDERILFELWKYSIDLEIDLWQLKSCLFKKSMMDELKVPLAFTYHASTWPAKKLLFEFLSNEAVNARRL